MKKLTDEELSRVLSVSAVGGLDYYECCLAMSAMSLACMPDYSKHNRAWKLSVESATMDGDWANYISNGDPEATLRMLESRGLA